jgi:hypothetical protein
VRTPCYAKPRRICVSEARRARRGSVAQSHVFVMTTDLDTDEDGYHHHHAHALKSSAGDE